VKKKLRQHFRRLIESIPPSVRGDKSLLAQRSLTALPEFASAQTVMIYLSMVEEVDTAHIARQAWAAGKRVLAPCVSLANRRMEAYEIRSLRDGLEPGPYDILQPTASIPWPPGQIDFIVVPALAFSRNGGRLGRGAGFYDRFLLRARDKTCNGRQASPIAVGLAFDEQVLDELPMFDHDQPIDLLVSDTGLWDFRKKGNLAKDAKQDNAANEII
jgi:5-formyltetrahydrofolate cyclo-ligase